jgi:hypothetical protein
LCAEVAAGWADQTISVRGAFCTAAGTAHAHRCRLNAKLGTLGQGASGGQWVGLPQQQGLHPRKRANAKENTGNPGGPVILCDCADLLKQGQANRKLMHAGRL